MAARHLARQCIVIGVDFGTTFSGVAWVKSQRLDRIELITEWNAVQYSNADKPKCPTVISYSQSERGGEPQWGYGIPVEDTTLKWLKLLVLDQEDLPDDLRHCAQLRTTRQQLRDLGKGPTEAISDYLKALWTHTLANIARAIGQSLLDSTPFHVVVTLPAIWPHYAQMRMREAIEVAGILDHREAGKTTLAFVSEPEAAAMATLDDLSDRADVRAGDHIVVCDAGGGTVDVITYTIVRISPMTIRESVKGDGKLCGGVVLDVAFLDILRPLLSRTIWDLMGPRAIKKLTNDVWEHGIKQSFRNITQRWNIPIPFGGTRADSFHPPEIEISGERVESVFENVIPQIKELVSGQVETVKQHYGTVPKFLILVGGLGKSVYLYDCLKQQMDRHGIEILQGSGERPWTAVCRGAVIKGSTINNLSDTVSVEVESRFARASYGTIFNELPFDPRDHHPADRVWCDVHQEFLAVEQTKWFLVTGDKLSANKPICAAFWQDVNNEDESIMIELVTSGSGEPPARKDSTVRTLCVIRLSRVPKFGELPQWRNKEGTVFRRFTYEIRMMSDGGSLDVGIYFKGKRLSSQHVSIEFSTRNERAVPRPATTRTNWT